MRTGRHLSLWVVALYALVTAVVTGCASRRADSACALRPDVYMGAAPADTSLHLSLSERLRYNALMVEASTLRLQGNSASLYDLLEHCLRINPDGADALYQMGLLRSFMEQRGMTEDTVGLQMLQRAALLDTGNVTYLHTLANLYLRQNKIELAQEVLEQLSVIEPRNTSVLSTLVDMYEYTDQYEDAIKILNRLELMQGKTPGISYRKFRCYREMDRNDEAYAEMTALCREYPSDPTYPLTVGTLLLSDERYDEALTYFQQVQQMDPATPGLQLAMLNYYRSTNADSLYAPLLNEIIYSPRTESDDRGVAISTYIADVQDTDGADSLIMAVFDSLDVLQLSDYEVLRTKAGYLSDRGDNSGTVSDEMIAVCERLFDLNPANHDLLYSLMQVYGEQQRYDRLEDICRRGVLNFPDELVCHFYLGVACYQQDQKAEALKAFQDGVAHKTADSNPRIVGELYGVMGDLLHDMGRPAAEVYAAYDSSLVYNPDNASALNNYAYYLSLDEDQLDRAEEMSYRSLRIEPNSKTYLDTYAWILFTKQRYVEAQAYIDRVCPPDSADSTLLADPDASGVVLEHAGDIAACNGNMEQALRFWRLALQTDDEHLTATLSRKIQLKKYIKP